jgi:hypothetical protein
MTRDLAIEERQVLIDGIAADRILLPAKSRSTYEFCGADQPKT